MRTRALPLRLLSVAMVVASLGLMIAARRAVSAPALPSVDAAHLVASVFEALRQNPAVSGDVLVHIDLGFPALPEVPGEPAGLTSYLSGDHRARVWRSADRLRISEMLPAAERSLYVSRSDVWVWDSAEFTAKHLRLPADPGGPDHGPGMVMAGAGVDPVEAAERALDLIGATTAVHVRPPVRVAGRSAYTLSLEPRTAETLVGRIEVSIDAVTRIPLRVAVFARGAAAPSLSTSFTSISYEPADASVFRFTPPAGATVEPLEPPGKNHGDGEAQAAAEPGGGSADGGRPRTFGQDWTTVLAVRVPPVEALLGNQTALPLAQLLPFSGPLFSVRLVDRGDHAWLLIGSVPQARLAELERSLP